LVSAGGTKTFRSTYKVDSKWITRKLGRFKDGLDLEKARRLAKEDRQHAALGVDPRRIDEEAARQEFEAKVKADAQTYEWVVDQFIEHYAKPRQRTWYQTEQVLKNYCSAWRARPFADITTADARTLLRGFIAQGHPYKAAVTQRWIKTLWKWAYKEELITENVMARLDVEIEKRERDRVYSDEEIKQIWSAADQLPDPYEAAYAKLMVLLAPRKSALACLERSHLDDPDKPTLWTTPFELTKSRKPRTGKKKRVYLIPLPPLAQRIIRGLKQRGDSPLLFPSLIISENKGGQKSHHDSALKARLKARGAPKDYYAHACRHTIATWLENEGHSEWERGLVLNHSGGGTVTAGYSHGYPLELKRRLLEKWARHVEQIVQPKGAVLLR
jgi:integrase